LTGNNQSEILTENPKPKVQTDFSSFTMLKHVVPFEQRLANYKIKRAEIFKKPSKRKSRNAKRLNSYWKTMKFNSRSVHKIIASLDRKSDDIRPYANVEILNRKMLGLLDSGAAVSCIGNDLANAVPSHLIKKSKVAISTADGNQQLVVGQVELSVQYKNINKPVQFLIVPSLKQNLILGFDFWQAFKISPMFLNQINLTDDPNLHSLTEEQAMKLDSIKNMFPSFAKEGLGKTTLSEHRIELVSEARPIKQRYFPVSPAIEKIIHQEIDEMLRLKVIEPAPESPWSSPMVLIRKPGKVRLCLDSRKINSLTKKDAYPLPHIDGILSRLPKAEYITSLDLSKAFWQIPLDESSRDYTCFTVPNRPLYRFTVMPFGLCNAPQALCRLMDIVIPNELRDEVFVYLDDLLIISDSFAKHMSVLAKVASRLRSAGLTINIEKSKFCLKEVKYLGFVVGYGTLKVDKEKISAVANYPPPTSVKQLRRFLGMSGWYRRFIENYASLTVPLTDLLKKGKGFKWTPDAQISFEALKDKLCSAPILSSPDYNKPFIIQTDASKLGVGAVLTQRDENLVEKPIAFYSKKLNKAQSNYSVTELECLAVILSLKKFRQYVEGQEFRVVTDHASLKWLMSQGDLSGRLARWAVKLQGFRFEIEHRRGIDNVVPDCLSRQNFEDIEELMSFPLVDIESSEFESGQYKSLIETLSEKQNQFPDTQIINNKIYKRIDFASGDQETEQFSWKLWIPEGLVKSAIERAHSPPNKNHGGIAKTLERLRLNFYWPKMATDVKQFVKTCEVCNTTKPPNTILRPPIKASVKAERPFQKIYIDFLGPYPRSKEGFIGIFIVLDHLTRFPLIGRIRKFSSETAIKFLKEQVISVFGCPEMIVSDNGKQFRCDLFEQFVKSRGIRHQLTALYSPQANASERVNRSIITGIRAYIGAKHNSWDKHLYEIGESLRSSFHQTLGCSPYFALFGQQMASHGADYKLFRQLHTIEGEVISRNDKLALIRKQLTEKIDQAFNKSAKRYNLRSSEVNIKIGDIVYRRNFPQSKASKKFCAKFAQKFIKSEVIGKVGNSIYLLKDLETGKTERFHKKDIKALSG